MANISASTRMVKDSSVNVIPKKRSHQGGQVGGDGGIDASDASTHHGKRRRRAVEEDNARERGKRTRKETVEQKESNRGSEAVELFATRRQKRKRDHNREDSHDTVPAAKEPGRALSPTKGKRTTSTDGQTNINISPALSTTQIQTLKIPEPFAAKVSACDWNLLCMKIRQSSRIRCKTRAAIAHLLSSDEHRNGETQITRRSERDDAPAPDETTAHTNGKTRDSYTQGSPKNDAAKNGTPIVLLQARADAASKLISIVEIAKRESACDGRRWTCFQYSGVEGRVEELRPRKKHKKRDKSKNAASMNTPDEHQIRSDGASGQQDRAGDPIDVDDDASKDMASLKPVKDYISDSEPESESDEFQTLSESRKKLRNMPYLTIYLARIRIPLLKSAYGLVLSFMNPI